MQKIILALLVPYLAVAGNTALADWVRVNGNDKVTAYADSSSIRKKGNLVKIWSLFDFKAENTLSDGSPYLSVMRETEFNCKDHVQHMLSYSIHSGNMAKGRVLDKGGDPQDWKPVAQSGIATSMMAFACSKD
jgi:hypothetical protein